MNHELIISLYGIAISFNYSPLMFCLLTQPGREVVSQYSWRQQQIAILKLLEVSEGIRHES